MFLCNFKNHKTADSVMSGSTGNGCVDTSVTSMNVCPSSQMTSASNIGEECAEDCAEDCDCDCEGEEGDAMVY